jgi:hypothetical protein
VTNALNGNLGQVLDYSAPSLPPPCAKRPFWGVAASFHVSNHGCSFALSPVVLALRSDLIGLWQAEEPEEDIDMRGGGQAAMDRRIVRNGYESDEDVSALRVNREMLAGEVPPTALSPVSLILKLIMYLLPVLSASGLAEYKPDRGNF